MAAWHLFFCTFFLTYAHACPVSQLGANFFGNPGLRGYTYERLFISCGFWGFQRDCEVVVLRGIEGIRSTWVALYTFLSKTTSGQYARGMDWIFACLYGCIVIFVVALQWLKITIVQVQQYMYQRDFIVFSPIGINRS